MSDPQNRPYYGSDTLFVGVGATAVCYYRVLLPAHALEADYVGLVGEPPNARFCTGLVGKQTRMPDFTAYKTVILQQPRGKGWLEIIRALQERGTTVIYEVDDWLHAVKNRPDHAFRGAFTNQDLAEYEACMKACDAMIVSTEFLAGVYRHFNRRVFVCRNGIDPRRYELTRPQRPTVNVGWAGATGHAETMQPWLQAVGEVMEERDNVCFVSIGQRFADALKPYFGPRAISTPFAAVEQYPAAMTMIDLALAPGGKSGFFRAKSDLRWLEAGALGIPIIADPGIYGEIEHGVTGFHADQPHRMKRLLQELIDDHELRTTVGNNARDYVLANRTMTEVAHDWRAVLEQISTQFA